MVVISTAANAAEIRFFIASSTKLNDGLHRFDDGIQMMEVCNEIRSVTSTIKLNSRKS